MWGLSDSAYKNTSIHDGLTWSEIIPKKKSLINKNDGQGDLVIAFKIKNNSLSICPSPYKKAIKTDKKDDK